jgi:hypothetical protein
VSAGRGRVFKPLKDIASTLSPPVLISYIPNPIDIRALLDLLKKHLEYSGANARSHHVGVSIRHPISRCRRFLGTVRGGMIQSSAQFCLPVL